MHTSRAYRPEIDGLRAVAVLVVILFHAEVPGFGGGYVGVDVFFVISGYLITSLILAEREAGTFSLMRFYERRARRILPMLMLVLAITVIWTWSMLFPVHARDVYQSVGAAVGMASNLLFWKESGYFDTAAEWKPLLHTWSLGVEEQFYLLYPLGMLALARLGKRWFVPIIGVVAVASLTAAQWVWRSDPDAAFYLLPTRGWELLAGGLLAWFLPNHRRGWQDADWHRRAQQVGALAGLALIVAPVALYPGKMSPAVLALPVIGAALVIAFGAPETLVGKLLCSRPVVGVGLISYSVYLVHQPLFVALRTMYPTPPSLATMLAMTSATLFLGWLSWRFVEQPFRRSEVVGRKSFVLIAAAGLLALGGIGVAGYFTHGFEHLFLAVKPERTSAVYRTTFESRRNPRQSECRFVMQDNWEDNARKFDACAAEYGRALVIIGDSHGLDLYGGIIQTWERPFVVFSHMGYCNPKSAERCTYKYLSDMLRTRRNTVQSAIFLGAGYPYIAAPFGSTTDALHLLRLPEPPTLDVDPKAVDARLDRIAVVADAVDPGRMVFLGPYIEPQLLPYVQIEAAVRCQPGRVAIHPSVIKTYARLDDFFARRVQTRPQIRYISSLSLFAADADSYLYDCDAAYWRDSDHLTAAGERRLAERLLAAHPEFALTLY